MLRWVEGFEEFAAAAGNAPTGLSTKYTVVNGTGSTLETGRTQGLGLRIWNNSANPTIQTPSFGNQSTLIIGIGFQVGITMLGGRIFEILDGATVQCAVYYNTSGNVEFRRGTTLLETSTDVVFALSTFCYLELKVVIGNTGSYEIKVNSTNVLSNGSIDTQASANAYAQTIKLWGSTAGDPTRGLTFDDWYVADGQAGDVTDFLGSHRALTFYPNGEGDLIEWTPSTGTDNSALVDETPHNSDTDYVESGTTGQQDLYTFENGTLVQIAGLQVNAVCRETDATPFSIKLVAKSGATTDEGSGVAIGTTSFVTRSRVLEQDPNTVTAWTDAGYDAAQFGIEIV